MMSEACCRPADVAGARARRFNWVAFIRDEERGTRCRNWEPRALAETGLVKEQIGSAQARLSPLCKNGLRFGVMLP